MRVKVVSDRAVQVGCARHRQALFCDIACKRHFVCRNRTGNHDIQQLRMIRFYLIGFMENIHPFIHMAEVNLAHTIFGKDQR